MLLNTLRKLRHGPLKSFSNAWVVCGSCYRYLVNKTGYSFPVNIHISHYGPFRFHPNFSFSCFEQWGREHNACFEQCVKSAKNKKCVIDIGAHIGLVTLPFSQVIHPEGKIYAFEPGIKNSWYLNYHLRKNNVQNVQVITELVGDVSKKQVPFYEFKKDTGVNSIAESALKPGYIETFKEQITLDTFCNTRELKPDLIKIDVEGAEYFVLKGAINVLKNYKPLIFLSVHPKHLQKLGISLEDLNQLIFQLGYSIQNHQGEVVSCLTLAEYRLVPV